MTADPGLALRVARRYPHPPERVWRALTDARLLAEWLMPNDFAPEVGHAFTLRTDPGPGFDGIVRAEVLALEPPTRMVWAWRGGPIDTIVTFTVLAHPEGSELVVEQAGFRGFAGAAVWAVLRMGWWNLLARRIPPVLAGA